MDVINFQNSEIRKYVRPATATPATAKNYNYRESNFIKENLIEETERTLDQKGNIITLSNADSSNDKEQTNSKQSEKDSDFEFAYTDNDLIPHQKEIEKYTNEENKRQEFINKQKEKLNKIDLIEKNVEDIYEWKSLLNKSRPITAYTLSSKNYIYKNEEEPEVGTEKYIASNLVTESLDKNILTCKSQSIKTEQNSNSPKREKKPEPFKFPIALINESEEKINDYIKFKNITKKRHIRQIHNNPLKNGKSDKINSCGDNIQTEKSLKDSQSNKSYDSRSLGVIMKNKIKVPEDIDRQTQAQTQSHSRSESNLNTNGRNSVKKHNATRPQSVYAKRDDNEVYYLNKAFSDYFTQDLSEFAAKFPLLQPKIKCNYKTLQKTLISVKQKELEDEKLLEYKKHDEDVIITDKEINLAGNSKNIEPLLRTMYNQFYSNSRETSFNREKEFRSKYIQDIRRVKVNSLPSNSKRVEFPPNFRMKLETYNINDPEIKIFSTVEENNVILTYEVDENIELNILKSLPEDLIEVKCSTQFDKDKKLVEFADNQEHLGINYSHRRPQTAIDRIKSPKKLQRFTASNRIQSAIGKSRPINTGDEIEEIDEEFYKQLLLTKSHMLTLNPNSILQKNTLFHNVIPYASRTLPSREKPGYQPFQYTALKNSMSSKKSKETFLKNAIKIEHVQQGIKANGCFDSINLEKNNSKINTRPNTSIDFRQIKNNFSARSKNDKTPIKFETRPKSKTNRISYVNFNDYIDVKFREMNPNSKLYNSCPKDEIPAYKVNFKSITNHKPQPDFNDLMKITNLKVDIRNIKSAKVKF